ncbi:DUF262 domain-containing protein [Brevibacterium picturae]|uniref:DUF262 domain-containing protein n=1 Tax=Brevibacterium picturae TaxID=260553 RepID=A0ABN2B392_9MICO
MITTASVDWLRPLSVRDIFETDSYRVPLYQRSYAWTEAEIHTLLRDIRDARLDSRVQAASHERRDYYIGSLVVNAERSAEGVVYEVVDGQQRLTTLFIILAVVPSILGNDLGGRAGMLNGRLTFEGRAGAEEDLLRLARDGKSAIERLSTDGIRHAAGLVATAAERARHGVDERVATLTQPLFSAEDLEYLLDNVKILRSELPQGTDLNHYFEVMNTRGEQLEKHEILKSRLISALDDAGDRENFSQVWDACTVLDRHIQTQFSTKQVSGSQSVRDRIFGRDWDRMTPDNGDELFNVLRDDREQNARGQVSEYIRLSDVLTKSIDRAEQSGSDDGDSDGSAYGAIVDFPNLLLHVLKAQQKESFTWASDLDDTGGGVRLEDKYLLSEFDRVRPISAESVRHFAFLLLKTRFLMDTYVIRTQKTTAGDDEENWVLHRAFKYSSGKTKRQLSARSTFSAVDKQADDRLGDDPSQRRVLMLQAMFQVTDTRRASKYFLYQLLSWLHAQEDSSRVDGEAFARHMESLAQDRLRALYTDATLHGGTQVPNFVFNVLDYELWRLVRTSGTNELDQLLGTDTVIALRKSASHFRFRYRTSVEHFYPVMPAAEQGHLDLPSELSNHFGNLCIMSRSENSRRNNLMPKAKAEEFAFTGQSLKFQLMAELSLRAPEWNSEQIHTHGDEMVGVLEYVLEKEPDVLP